MRKKVSKKENLFCKLLDIMSDAIYMIVEKINSFLTNKKKSSLVKSILRIICAFVVVILLEIPFFLIEKLGEGILYLCNLTFNNLAVDVWGTLIDYAYVLFALIFFLKIIVDMSKKKEYNFELKGAKKAGSNLYYSLQSVLRLVVVLFLIPLGLLGILLFAVLGMQVALLTHGIHVFGPMLMIIGMLLMITFLLSYLYDIVFQNKGGNE